MRLVFALACAYLVGASQEPEWGPKRASRSSRKFRQFTRKGEQIVSYEFINLHFDEEVYVKKCEGSFACYKGECSCYECPPRCYFLPKSDSFSKQDSGCGCKDSKDVKAPISTSVTAETKAYRKWNGKNHK
eukprot:Platyproteum_vivax@DN5848_c0_g1_i2.p2